MTRSGTGLVLCADDYGMNEGISQSIRELAEARRISATSCMTNSPHWPEAARALSAAPGIGVGLHLTLTWGQPLGAMGRLAPDRMFPPLGRLMRDAFIGWLDRNEIESEIERQLDAFVGERGAFPDFVDGHQHVHVLPVVRQALLSVLTRRGLAGRLWLRDSGDRVASIVARRVSVPKALFVRGLSRGFRRDAAEAGFGTNVGFSGFSSFDPRRPVGEDMKRYLTRLGPSPLVMCHPGVGGHSDRDEIAEARRREHEYLRSAEFGDLLAERGATLMMAPTSKLDGEWNTPWASC